METLRKNKKLMLYLAKNDFRTKYAGSYFGIFWAFVQPLITILLYWFVFQLGYRKYTICALADGRSDSMVLFFRIGDQWDELLFGI